jgi:hypothetical protein
MRDKTSPQFATAEYSEARRFRSIHETARA